MPATQKQRTRIDEQVSNGRHSLRHAGLAGLTSIVILLTGIIFPESSDAAGGATQTVPGGVALVMECFTGYAST